jgi:hypothetical protein
MLPLDKAKRSGAYRVEVNVEVNTVGSPRDGVRGQNKFSFVLDTR